MKTQFKLSMAWRGAISLAILLLFAIPALAMLFPARVLPADASAELFSAGRALPHLAEIAKEPHPQGSAAQARVRDYLAAQLALYGLEVEIQQAGGLDNVTARLRGSDSTGAVVILAHYDTEASSPGAGDNGSADSALLEVARAAAAGPGLKNDIIILFDDGEEWPDIFAGTKAFVRRHPWMKDVRIAISIDTAVAGPISTNVVGPTENGWLVQVLSGAYTGGAWTSFSGGGQYNSEPFSDAGIQVLALEDNYPFRQQHTAEDTPAIIRPSSLQQMGEQTLSIARALGNSDLSNPRGEQETFFAVPFLGLMHYPQAWSLPLAVSASVLLLLALGLALWRKLISVRGTLTAMAVILVMAAAVVLGISALKPLLPGIFGWRTAQWPEWPEVIPPYGWIAAAGLDFLALALFTGCYILARRWSKRADFSFSGLVPFCGAAIFLAANEPRTAYAFLWPVIIGAVGWIITALPARRAGRWLEDAAALLPALALSVLLLVFIPGIVMADGMKSLEILAGAEVLILAVVLPAIDGLIIRGRTRSKEINHEVTA